MQNPECKVSFVLSSRAGFGHASRAIAVASQLRDSAHVDFLADTPVHDYINENLGNRQSFLPIDYTHDMSEGEYFERNQGLIENFATTGTIVNDFHIQTEALGILKKLAGNTNPFVGIYHSLTGYRPQSREVNQFQMEKLAAASKLDILFLSELQTEITEPFRLPSGTQVIPCGLIVRKPDVAVERVKYDLGLAETQEFIYVQGGGVKNGEDLDYFMESIGKLSIGGLKIVIASRTATEVTHQGDVVVMPVRSDGHNVINASSGVISKPGMSTISETIAARKPILLLDYPVAEASAKYNMLSSLLGELPFKLSPQDDATRKVNQWLDAADKMSDIFAKVDRSAAHRIAQFLLRV